ncbi:antibiotic biosynthesis monooxygenase family protein [Actinoplanes sp. NPDC051851]|uniref:antibiotic biosynthesis monooxygenase family protein n=1 Tax=Actinoplanes sp. NPDC051851 TaxID=3154753 RepID=UPI00342EFA79
MLLEVTLIDVLPGREADFLSAYELARPLIATAESCHGVHLKRALDSPRRFVLLAEWTSAEAHERDFRRTERFAQWRAHIFGTLSQPPVADFFTDLPTDFFSA